MIKNNISATWRHSYWHVQSASDGSASSQRPTLSMVPLQLTMGFVNESLFFLSRIFSKASVEPVHITTYRVIAFLCTALKSYVSDRIFVFFIFLSRDINILNTFS